MKLKICHHQKKGAEYTAGIEFDTPKGLAETQMLFYTPISEEEYKRTRDVAVANPEDYTVSSYEDEQGNWVYLIEPKYIKL